MAGFNPTHARSGWLLRQGGIMKSWSRVWVELCKTGTLDYFKTAKDPKPIGDVTLKHYTVEAIHPSKADGKDAFRLVPRDGSNKTIMFAGKNTAERDAWVTDLEKIIGLVSDSGAGADTSAGPSSSTAMLTEDVEDTEAGDEEAAPEEVMLAPGGRIPLERNQVEDLQRRINELTLDNNNLKMENAELKRKQSSLLEEKVRKQKLMINELRRENEDLVQRLKAGGGSLPAPAPAAEKPDNRDLMIRQLTAENEHLKKEREEHNKLIAQKLKLLITEKQRWQGRYEKLLAAGGLPQAGYEPTVEADVKEAAVIQAVVVADASAVMAQLQGKDLNASNSGGTNGISADDVLLSDDDLASPAPRTSNAPMPIADRNELPTGAPPDSPTSDMAGSPKPTGAAAPPLPRRRGTGLSQPSSPMAASSSEESLDAFLERNRLLALRDALKGQTVRSLNTMSEEQLTELLPDDEARSAIMSALRKSMLISP